GVDGSHLDGDLPEGGPAGARPGASDEDGTTTGKAAELGAVPSQRPARNGVAAPAGVTHGVTHSRPWTQKDM
ncbi:RNA polymerase sigma factor, partial [Streptomyces sp. 24-1644]